MDAEWLQELFSGFAPVRVKRMFGGQGIFYRNLNFGVVADDVLHLKVDDETRADFEAEGCGPWVLDRKSGKKVSTGYWTAPESAMDDPDAFEPWARQAFEAAMRADAVKPPSKRKLDAG